jgi:hypothetical protein
MVILFVNLFFSNGFAAPPATSGLISNNCRPCFVSNVADNLVRRSEKNWLTKSRGQILKTSPVSSVEDSTSDPLLFKLKHTNTRSFDRIDSFDLTVLIERELSKSSLPAGEGEGQLPPDTTLSKTALIFPKDSYMICLGGEVQLTVDFNACKVDYNSIPPGCSPTVTVHFFELLSDKTRSIQLAYEWVPSSPDSFWLRVLPPSPLHPTLREVFEMIHWDPTRNKLKMTRPDGCSKTFSRIIGTLPT